MAANGPNNPLTKVLGSLRKSARSRSEYWPSHVLDTLESKYHLRPAEMLRLRYIEDRFSNGRHPDSSSVNSSLFIYDGVKANDKNVAIRNRADIYANSDLLVFRGNLLVDGSVRLQKVSNI